MDRSVFLLLRKLWCVRSVSGVWTASATQHDPNVTQAAYTMDYHFNRLLSVMFVTID